MSRRSDLDTNMPYFFILPAYLILVLGLLAAATVARFIPGLRVMSGYIFAGCLGTVPGFLITNVAVTLVALFPMWVDLKVTLPDWLQGTLILPILGTLLLGPFIASFIGIALGFMLGIWMLLRRRRRQVAAHPF